MITIQRVVVHLDGPRVVRLKVPPDAPRQRDRRHPSQRRTDGGRRPEPICAGWRSSPRRAITRPCSGSPIPRRARSGTSSRKRRRHFSNPGRGSRPGGFCRSPATHLVFRARGLGTPLPLRLRNRAAENPITSGLGRAARVVRVEPEKRRADVRRPGDGIRPRSVLPAYLSDRLRRDRQGPAHAGGHGSRGCLFAVGPLSDRHAFLPGRSADDGLENGRRPVRSDP